MSFVYDQSSFPLGNINLTNYGNNFFDPEYLDKLNAFKMPSFASANVGNVAGVANATSQTPSSLETGAAMLKAIYGDPDFQSQPEAVRIATLNSIGQLGNTMDLRGVMEQLGINQKELQEGLIQARKEEAAQANEWGKENLKLTNELRRSNSVLDALLAMPGQISDSWARAATAGLPYQQEARQMMANTAANLQTGYTNLANMNTQFGNQVTNLFSNAAAYRPTITPLAGKYFA